jgi:hypothetical protein
VTRKLVRYDPNEIILYGLAEAADYLELSRSNLAMLRKAGKMVEPVAQLQCGPVWSQSQLDEQLYLWQGRHGRWDEQTKRKRWISRRLTILDRRWAELVDAVYHREKPNAQYMRIEAAWRNGQAKRRRRQGLRAIATPSEAVRAYAEAKLLRLVHEKADEEPVLAKIRAELDEAFDLRQELQAIEQARAGFAVDAEGVEVHGRDASGSVEDETP